MKTMILNSNVACLIQQYLQFCLGGGGDFWFCCIFVYINMSAICDIFGFFLSPQNHVKNKNNPPPNLALRGWLCCRWVWSFRHTNLKQNVAKSFAQICFAIPDDSHVFNFATIFKVTANALFLNGYGQTQKLMYEQMPQRWMHKQKRCKLQSMERSHKLECVSKSHKL